MEATAPIPDALLQAARDHRLVIFSGSGLSKLAPSSLPDWRQFNEMLLDELKTQALGVLADDTSRSAVTSLSLDEVGVTTFSEAIVKIVAGEGYFPVLQVLDSDRTNANHQAMADLARQGILQAIVTTNFDTLIERAFTEAGVPLQVAITPEAYLRPIESGTCTLYKVHGSVTDATTLVDTVGQKLRGLPAFVRFRLAQLFAAHHALIVGFSGADLDFGPDYFSFSTVDLPNAGLTWGIQPNTQPSAHVVALEKRFVGHANHYEVTLPDLFFQLGALKRRQTVTTEDEDHRLAGERAQPRIAAIFAGFGARNSLALCMRLLADAGRTDSATVLHRALSKDIESRANRLVPSDGPAIRALAVTADLLGDGRAAGDWKQLEVHYLERRLRSWQRRSRNAKLALAESDGWNFNDQREVERLLAGAWTNLGIDLFRHGRIAEGGKALKRSLDYCELSGDLISLAAMFGAWVDWQVIAGRDPDEVLLWGWIAEAAGLAAGNVDAANFAALLRAEQSLLLGEYDSALAALDRVRRRKPLGPSVELAIEVARLTGVIQVRRGRPDDALATWRQSLEQLTTSEVLAARVRWTIVTSLSYDPTFREALIEEADKLLAALRNGAVIEGTAGIPHVEELESAKLDLAKGKGRLPEFFDSSPADATSPALRQQAEIWQQLVQAEATGDQATILLCLRLLGQQLYEGQKALRAREVAMAQLAVAERAGDLMEQIAAKWVLGNVLAALGDTAAARQILAALNAIQFLGDPAFNARVTALLERLDADPRPRQVMLDVIDRIEGREIAVRSADDRELLARHALQTTEFGVMRVLALEVLALRRLSADAAGIGRCYEILAKAAALEGRTLQARTLRTRARQS